MFYYPTVSCRNANEANDISIRMEKASDGISYAHISFSFDEPTSPSKATFIFRVPCIDVFSTWHPRARMERHVAPNWRKLSSKSRLAFGAPVLSMIAKNGSNRVTAALSDAQTPCSISCGVVEETAELEFRIDIFTEVMSPMTAFEITLRIDERDIPFYDTLSDTEAWWRNDLGFVEARVPDAARMPMDSLWYSFHQELDPDAILAECRASKALGMDTVIIDDGWQTDNNNRGYSYCGDWEVTPTKIPDMKKLVDDLHDIGMKVIVWFSVPYVGIHSRAYERFEGMYLWGSRDRSVMTLDPRYPEVRKYLVDTYVHAVTAYGLDGLKLDFIDDFKLTDMSVGKTFDGEYMALENGLELLLEETMTELSRVNPDIMIEFRQAYIGPTIRKYGNILRVADCPNDAQSNRLGVLDLRLISGRTAVHSDMIMWHSQETNEAAAVQLQSVMFGVPQISLHIPEISEEHKTVVSHFLSFWREHREILLDGKLTVRNPEMGFSLAAAEKDGTTVAVRYLPVSFAAADGHCYLFNATAEELVPITLNKGSSFTYTVTDCLGKCLEEGRIADTAVACIKAPMGACIELIPVEA